jgi:hypothetical protein
MKSEGYFERRSVSVLLGIEKWLYCLPQSQNNCIGKSALIGNLVNHIEVQLGGVKPSRDC